jgi:hypothetical protein
VKLWRVTIRWRTSDDGGSAEASSMIEARNKDSARRKGAELAKSCQPRAKGERPRIEIEEVVQ